MQPPQAEDELFESRARTVARQITNEPNYKLRRTAVVGGALLTAGALAAGGATVMDNLQPKVVKSEIVTLGSSETTDPNSVSGLVESAVDDLALEAKVDPAAIPNIQGAAIDASNEAQTFRGRDPQPGDPYEVTVSVNGFGVPSVDAHPVESVTVDLPTLPGTGDGK